MGFDIMAQLILLAILIGMVLISPIRTSGTNNLEFVRIYGKTNMNTS